MHSKKILITGSQGFVCSYICQELLQHGYNVIGVDNYSKCGIINKPHDNHKNFTFYNQDVTLPNFHTICMREKPDIIIAGAALVGGITYYSQYQYDILSHNEKININTFDAAIKLHNLKIFNKIILLSSSLVYEQETHMPYKEDTSLLLPKSCYSMQKLVSEYFCYGIHDQYGISYNIARLFNCVGKEKTNYVLSDLVTKIKTGNIPISIFGDGSQIRSFIHGKDIAIAIRFMIEKDISNECFNVATTEHISILQLAQKIWTKIYGNLDGFSYVSQPVPNSNYDVTKSVANVSKIHNMLGFVPSITIDQTIDEILQ